MEKKAKVKKAKTQRVSLKERMGSLFFTVIALIVAMAVFAGFMFLQSYFSEHITYKEVLVVTADIPEGEIITEENIGNYFGQKKMNALDTIEGAYSLADIEQLYGKRARVTLCKGGEVTPNDFEDINVYLDFIEKPVELSIATSGIEATDGGKIRAGDIVNITLMFTKEQLGMIPQDEGNDSSSVNGVITVPQNSGMNAADYYASSNQTEDQTEKEENIGTLSQVNATSTGKYDFQAYARYMLENIYIKKVLSSDGVEIAPTDKDTPAAIIVLVVPKEIELELTNIIANCQAMRISKVLYKVAPEDIYQDTSIKDDVVPELVEIEEEPVEPEEIVLPSDGWTEADENGVSYAVSENPGVFHYGKDADGNGFKEDCLYEENGTECIRCHSKLPEEDAISNEDVEPSEAIETTETETSESTVNE